MPRPPCVRRYPPEQVFLKPRRTMPRPRHEVPRALLVVLLPVFRYCHWRSAWILRGIGEKHGPVLLRAGGQPPVTAAPPITAAPAFPGPVRREDRLPAIRGRTPWALLALSGALVVAILGFMVARAIQGNGAAAVTLDKHASAGLLAVSFPSDWRTEAPPATPRLALSDELALAPAASGGGTLVIGRRVTADPNLLPASLLASLPSVPSQQIVTLGNTRFYRYVNLSPIGQSTSETVYALPTTVGTILGVCITQGAPASFTGSCERVLGTLKLGSGTVLPLGPSTSYATGLDAVIKRLNAVRDSASSRLRSANSAQAQAKSATALAAAHAAAAVALSRLNAGTASTANSSLAAALTTTGNAYDALARAAASNDTAAYRTASRALTRATKALSSAFAQLSTFGYRVT